MVVNGSLAPGWEDSEWQAQVLIAAPSESQPALRATFQEDYGLVSLRSASPVQGVVLVSLTFSSEVRSSAASETNLSPAVLRLCFSTDSGS